MNTLIVLAASAAVFILGYRYYSRYIASRALGLDNSHKTPAQELNDGVDFVPTRPIVLFGHHFASIAGLGPIVGPAIAVIWGWVPAVVWVVLGTVFIGAVHDFVTLGISIRHKGRSIGDIADRVIGSRGRVLFLLIILFALVLAMGVFVLVIADLWSYYGADKAATAHPEAVVPSLGLIVIALIIGFILRTKDEWFKPVMTIGVILMFALIFLGVEFPIALEMKSLWVYLLLVYAFVASVMPVWMILQPRDFLSSFNLYAMLALMIVGFLVIQPAISAPAINMEAINNPEAALPSMIPFLFITIACGAVSGFHCMVSSGTSSKQLRQESDARVVGYGGMVTEGFLAVLVILACTAGYALADWQEIYSGWIGGKGVGVTIGAFVTGAANIAAAMGIPLVVGQTFFAVTVIAFAMTSLDTGTRLIRITIDELLGSLKLPDFLRNRYATSAVAVTLIGYFALMKIDGKPAGVALWALFGTSNQLLAGIALLVATIYFFKQKKPSWFTFLPMVFMLIITTVALVMSLRTWIADGFSKNAPLIVVGSIIIGLLGWLVVEAILSFSAYSRQEHSRKGKTASAESGA